MWAVLNPSDFKIEDYESWNYWRFKKLDRQEITVGEFLDLSKWLEQREKEQVLQKTRLNELIGQLSIKINSFQKKYRIQSILFSG